MWSGLTYYHLGEYQQALDTYLSIDGLAPRHAISERIRLQFLNQQAQTSLKLGNLERAVTYLSAGASGARDLGSKVRYDEALRVYQAMTFLHPSERQVRDLKPLFTQAL
jgi:tetratricopeptide (TPR) repeat protein